VEKKNRKEEEKFGEITVVIC